MPLADLRGKVDLGTGYNVMASAQGDAAGRPGKEIIVVCYLAQTQQICNQQQTSKIQACYKSLSRGSSCRECGCFRLCYLYVVAPYKSIEFSYFALKISNVGYGPIRPGP
jgi:hypothetical protein